MEKAKRKIIILDGPDKVGKSTLKKKLALATDFKPLIIDRGWGSHFVYSRFYKRHENPEEYIELERRLFMGGVFNIEVYLVIVTCNEFVFYSRNIVDSKDLIDEANKNFVECDRLFGEVYFNRTHIRNKMILDTSGMTVNESVDKILEFVGWKINPPKFKPREEI